MKLSRVTISRKKGIILLYALLMALVFLKHGIGVNIPTECMLIVALSISVFGSNDDNIALVMCCIPLYSSIPYIAIIVFSMICFLVKNAVSIKVGHISISSLMLCVWELAHCFVGIFSVKYIVIIIVPYLLMLIIYSYKGKTFDYVFIVRTFASFVCGTGITLLTRTVMASGMGLWETISNMKRLGAVSETDIGMEGAINPNSLGIMCVLAIAGLMQIYLYRKRRTIDFFEMFLLIVIGILTLSRTFIICFAEMIVFFAISERKNLKKNVKLIIVVGCVLGISSFALVQWFPEIIQAFFSRWGVSDLSNGRISIFQKVTSYIWNNPVCYLFGIGLSDFTNRATELATVAPHDAINELIMAWGIPGGALFVGYLILVINGAKKKNPNIMLVNYIPLIIIITKALAGHLITSGYTMVAIALVYLSLIYDFNESRITIRN